MTKLATKLPTKLAGTLKLVPFVCRTEAGWGNPIACSGHALLCREGCCLSGASMAKAELSSMWWRSCRDLIQSLQSDRTLSCSGLSNLCELPMNLRAGGVGDLGTRVLPGI